MRSSRKYQESKYYFDGIAALQCIPLWAFVKKGASVGRLEVGRSRDPYCVAKKDLAKMTGDGYQAKDTRKVDVVYDTGSAFGDGMPIAPMIPLSSTDHN